MYFDPWPVMEAKRGAKNKRPKEGDGPGRTETPGKKAGEALPLGGLSRAGGMWTSPGPGKCGSQPETRPERGGCEHRREAGSSLRRASETSPSQAGVCSRRPTGWVWFSCCN